MSSIEASRSDDGRDRPVPGRLVRLRHTPLRDIVRGRLTGRLDLEACLSDADLPPSLAEIVRRTVRRTRLHRLEKADVTRELAAHFADGLESGADPAALGRGFGDARRAALLIRRAKRRARPWPWRALAWTRNAAIALVVAYVGFGLYIVSGSPSLSVDYLPQVNAAAAAVPEDERAWPVYRAALLELEPLPAFERLSRMPRPGEVGWDEAATYLAAQADALAVARGAADRAGLGYLAGFTVAPDDRVLWPEMATDHETWPGEDSMFAILLPHMSELRKLARVYALDAQAAAATGDGDRCAANISAMLAIGRHLRESPFLIGDLVAFSAVVLAAQTTGDILARHPDGLTDDHLLELAHRFAAAGDLLTPRFDGERLALHDLAQRIYTDDGDGDGRMTVEGLRFLESFGVASNFNRQPDGGVVEQALQFALLPGASAAMMSRREFIDEYDRLMAQIERHVGRPLWEMSSSGVDQQLERWMGNPFQRWRHMPLVLLMPALGKVVINAQIAEAEREGVVTAIAIELYRRREGRWPASLDDLVPVLLPVVPRDRFDGRPLRYAVADGRPVLYSVGTDRDDDGGLSPVASNTGAPMHDGARRWLPLSTVEQAQAQGNKPWLSVPDGDWVVWPRRLDPVVEYPGVSGADAG